MCIRDSVGPVEIHRGTQPVDQAAPAPGMLARHYAPNTPIVLVTDPPAEPPGPRAGLLSLTRPGSTDGWARIEVLSETGDLVEATAGFFAALHRLDDAELEQIVAQGFPETGLGVALNNRLERAAAQA